MLITRRRLDTDALWKRFSAMSSCTHAQKEVRKRTIKGGSIVLQEQCPACGEKFGSAISKEKFSSQQLAKMKAWDEQLAATFRSKQTELWNQLKAEEEAKGLAEWQQAHAAYIASPAWKKKRNAVIKRANALCEGCGEQKATEVHHLNYDHLGEEFLFELVAICRSCHERYHAESQIAQISQSNNSGNSPHESDGDDDDCPF